MPATKPVVRETPDIVTASDDYARRFSGRAGAYMLEVQQQAVMAALDFRRTGRCLLEVGGGHAQLAPGFAAAGYDVTVLGSHADCHRRFDDATYPVNCVTGDLLDLPIADQSVDTVVAVRLIAHIEDWPTLIEEFCRVARQTVILDFPSLVGPNALGPLLFGMKKSLEGNTRRYTSFFQYQLTREFHRHGFRASYRHPQFLLPMVLHRRFDSPGWLRALETVARGVGLTGLFGTPVILRLDRQ